MPPTRPERHRELIEALSLMAYRSHDLLQAEIEGSREPRFSETALNEAEKSFVERDIPRNPLHFCSCGEPDLGKVINFMRRRAMHRTHDERRRLAGHTRQTETPGEDGSPVDALPDDTLASADDLISRVDAKRVIDEIERALPSRHRIGWEGYRWVYGEGRPRHAFAARRGLRDDHLGTLIHRAVRWVRQYLAGRQGESPTAG